MSGEADAPGRDIGRAALGVSAVNVISRLTGFVRVVATGAALGIAALGDTYQSANVVSNVLFELLAGGLLFAVLVPAFVGQLTDGDRDGARRLAGVLIVRLAAGLGAVALVGVLLSPWLARALLAGAPDATRPAQVDLAAVLLWFVLPQVVLYGVGAVITALLQADHRFIAAAAAPIANNLVVTATMVAFAVVHDAGDGLVLDTTDKLVLGGGTLLGTVAMTAIVAVAAARGGLVPPLRWADSSTGPLGRLARQGAWGAGHIGLNQVMVLSTVLIAGRVAGGAIAYTFAFVFFLLPHAVIAHPIVTTLTPTLAAHAHRGDAESCSAELSRGVRMLVVLLAPSAALLAVLGWPGLHLIEGLGALEADGLRLVAATLAAYATGLVGYSVFFLLTRAAYALGDVRGPTLVNLGATAGAVVGMVVVSATLTGEARVWSLGLMHGAAVSIAALVLGRRVAAATAPLTGVGPAAARAGAAALAGGSVAWAVVAIIGFESRLASAAALAVGGVLGGGAVLGLLAAVRAPELSAVTRRLGSRRAGRGDGGGASPARVLDDSAVADGGDQ